MPALPSAVPACPSGISARPYVGENFSNAAAPGGRRCPASGVPGPMSRPSVRRPGAPPAPMRPGRRSTVIEMLDFCYV